MKVNPQADRPDEETGVVIARRPGITALAARGGVISGRVITVLVTSMTLALVAMVAVLVYYNGANVP